MELQLRGVNQELLSEPENSLFVEGVIYGIAHIPSNKVYTGQTIHSAYSRFKRHWHSRKTLDHRNRHLHRLMAKQDTRNFIVWPLEKIDLNLYSKGGQPNLKDFRRAATPRENFWVHRLRTIFPKGLNSVSPIARQHNTRRQRRPNRWSNRPFKLCGNTTIHSYASVQNGKLTIDTKPGPALHLRKTVNKWITLAENLDTQN